MITEVDNGFTAEKDISAYTKAASQAKPVVLGFNRWVKKKKKKISADLFRQRWAYDKRKES